MEFRESSNWNAASKHLMQRVEKLNNWAKQLLRLNVDWHPKQACEMSSTSISSSNISTSVSMTGLFDNQNKRCNQARGNFLELVFNPIIWYRLIKRRIHSEKGQRTKHLAESANDRRDQSPRYAQLHARDRELDDRLLLTRPACKMSEYLSHFRNQLSAILNWPWHCCIYSYTRSAAI